MSSRRQTGIVLYVRRKYHIQKEYGETERLQYLKAYYQSLVPQDYRGRLLAPSDIVELYGKEGRRYFYVGAKDFEPVRFSPFLAKPLPQNETKIM